MSKRNSTPKAQANKGARKALPAPSQPAQADAAAPAPKTKRGRKPANTAPQAATEKSNGKHAQTIAQETAHPAGYLLKIGDVYAQEVGSIEAAQGLFLNALAELAQAQGGEFVERFPDGQLYKDGTQVARINRHGRAFSMSGEQIGAFLTAPQSESKAADAEALEPAMSVTLPIKYVNAALAIAAKKDASRPYLCAVYLHQMEDLSVRLVASDGHRMIVLSTECDRELNWGKAGVLLPRAELDRISRYCGKGEEVQLDVSFGPKHPAVNIAEHLGMGKFTLAPVDHQFVDYQRLMAQVGEVVGSDAQLTPADTAAINRDYLKAAGVVAASLESASVRPFIDPSGKHAAVFTFDDPGAILVVMPMRVDAPALKAPTMKLLGEAGMSRTLAALKAHETRCRKAAAETKSKDERAKLEGQANVYAERIAEIRSVIAALPPAQTQTTAETADEEAAEV